MRILIIEDDKSVSESLKSALKNESYSVDVASDGERGSYLARTNDYDLVLLDNILPKKQGVDVCKEIRNSGKTYPIIVITSRDEIPDKVSMLDMGADDYVTKPFSYEELMARIRAVTRRPHGTISHSLAVADLLVDLSEQTVKRNGKEIYLTKKEFSLLSYFCKNQDKVLTRGMIMEHVWDINADPFSNTIEVHILNLRKKIDDGYTLKLIHTVPGRGYKMSAK